MQNRIVLGGSSPLTRGTQEPSLRYSLRLRFIPAYAGNSSFAPSPTAEITVHPRLRGELKPLVIGVLFSDGSSPLTRGTLLSLSSDKRMKRFIPAYAGNSSRRQTFKGRHQGSSPLTRGTLPPDPINIDDVRFIPAYAGNSSVFSDFRVTTGGSSPLTRGTHLKTV